LRQLISSLRQMPRIPVAPRPVHLEVVIGEAMREIQERAATPGAPVVVDVPKSLLVAVDATAIGFVIDVVVSVLGVNGRDEVRIAAVEPPAGAVTATLTFSSDAGAESELGFTTRTWAGADAEAISFAVARRVARASDMVLRPSSELERGLSLEIPLVAPDA
jgi:hypothetical protein